MVNINFSYLRSIGEEVICVRWPWGVAISFRSTQILPVRYSFRCILFIFCIFQCIILRLVVFNRCKHHSYSITHWYFCLFFCYCCLSSLLPTFTIQYNMLRCLCCATRSLRDLFYENVSFFYYLPFFLSFFLSAQVKEERTEILNKKRIVFVCAETRFAVFGVWPYNIIYWQLFTTHTVNCSLNIYNANTKLKKK